MCKQSASSDWFMGEASAMVVFLQDRMVSRMLRPPSLRERSEAISTSDNQIASSGYRPPPNDSHPALSLQATQNEFFKP